jgi:hypothetical protein
MRAIVANGIVGPPRVDQHEAAPGLDVELVVHPARDRRPAECDREHQDHHQAPPEDRHRRAGDGRAHQPVVERRAALHGCDHAERQSHDHAEQQRAQRQLQGCRKQLRELRPHAVLRHHRAAEVAARDLALVS